MNEQIGLLYYQINLAFFLQESYQTPNHQERTKDTKKDYFFFVNLAFAWSLC
jgi:hypothetical protein